MLTKLINDKLEWGKGRRRSVTCLGLISCILCVPLPIKQYFITRPNISVSCDTEVYSAHDIPASEGGIQI